MTTNYTYKAMFLKSLLLLTILFGVNAFGEVKLSPKLIKIRSENSAQWKECKETYKTYADFMRSKIKENKRIPYSELQPGREISNKISPLYETMFACQTDGFYTETESGNITEGMLCITMFSSSPISAKKSQECKNMMKADSF